MANPVKPVYTLASTALTSIGVYVTSATGLFSIPKMKTPQTVDWPDKNGVTVDLAAPRFQARAITLNCLSKGADTADALAGFTAVVNLLKTTGLKTLTVAIGNSSYSYSVYCKEGVEITAKRSGGGKVVIEYAIKLEEPHPVNFVPSDT